MENNTPEYDIFEAGRFDATVTSRFSNGAKPMKKYVLKCVVLFIQWLL